MSRSEARRTGAIGFTVDLVLGLAVLGLAECILVGLLEKDHLGTFRIWRRATLVHAGLGVGLATLLVGLGRFRPRPVVVTGILASLLATWHFTGTFAAALERRGPLVHWGAMLAIPIPAVVAVFVSRSLSAARTATRLLATVVVLGTLVSGAIRDRHVRSAISGPNVLFIVLDTTRKDRMSVYGYDRPTTPALERLTAQGTRFDRAISSSPWTLPAHASMFTGLHPSQHGATRPSHWLRDDVPTLAETMAISGRQVVAFGKKAWLAHESGVMRGFDEYIDLLNPVPAPSAGGVLDVVRRVFPETVTTDDKGAAEINQNVFRWLDDHVDRPFFAFINYNEAHAHLEPPSPYREEYLGARHDSKWGREEHPDLIAYNAGEVDYDAEDIRVFNDLYDAEVAYQDEHLGHLFDHLREQGLLDRTLVIVTADHGESLGEHDEFGHGQCMHEPVLNVPLLIRLPGLVPEGAVVSAAVETRNLAPFVEQAVRADADVAGDALLQVLAPGDDGVIVSEVFQRPRPRSSVQHDMWAVYAANYKLIVSSRGGHQLYDLKDDPAERNNLIDQETDVVERLARFVREHRDRRRAAGPAADLSPETIENLKAMGYLADSPGRGD